MEEENYAAVSQVYKALGYADRVRYHWYAGDHDTPPEARGAAVEWFRRWFYEPATPRKVGSSRHRASAVPGE